MRSAPGASAGTLALLRYLEPDLRVALVTATNQAAESFIHHMLPLLRHFPTISGFERELLRQALAVVWVLARKARILYRELTSGGKDTGPPPPLPGVR